MNNAGSTESWRDPGGCAELSVVVRITDAAALREYAKRRYRASWQDSDWEPASAAEAALEALVLSNENPSPADYGIEIVTSRARASSYRDVGADEQPCFGEEVEEAEPPLEIGRPLARKLMRCPHCGAEQLHHYRDAYVRHGVCELEDGSVCLDASELTVLQYESTEVVCDECGKYVELDDAEIESVFPRFEFDPAALQLGFERHYGSDCVSPLSTLPTAEVESFGDFAGATISRALGEWGAITASAGMRLYLIALFPYAEQLLPVLRIAGHREALTAAPFLRGELERAAGVNLGHDDIAAAQALCERTVESANKMLRERSALVEFEE